MVVKINGEVIGHIALVGTARPCPYEGKHGYLPYGFFRNGASVPEVVVCDEHCHTEDGYFAGLLSKVDT
jgi:hypothetical protein